MSHRTTDPQDQDYEEHDLPTRIAHNQLINRLLDHLGDDISRETTSGLTLPASAVVWLSEQLEQAISSSGRSHHATSLHDHHNWRLLESLLHHAARMRITSSPWPKKTSHPKALFHLRIFPNLKVLWLDKVPINWLIDFAEAKRHLQVLRIEHACIYNLSTSVLLKDGLSCETLTHLKLSYCDLGERSGLRPKRNQKAALCRLCPNVQSLNLSHNQLQTDICLLGLHKIVKLDLSYNSLRNWTDEALANSLQVLNLAHNQIESVSGIEKLANLRILHLEYNHLRDLYAVASGLASLNSLAALHLEGNPLQFRTPLTNESRIRRKVPTYRIDILNAFRERRFSNLTSQQVKAMKLRDVKRLLPQLDGKPPSVSELRSLRSRTFVPVDRPVITDTVTISPPSLSMDSVDEESSSAVVKTGEFQSPKRKLPRKRRKALIRTSEADPNEMCAAIVQRQQADLSPEAVRFTALEIVAATMESSIIQDASGSDKLDATGGNNTGSRASISLRQIESSDSTLDYLDENIGRVYLASIPIDFLEKSTNDEQQPVLDRSSSKISDEATLPIVNGEGATDAKFPAQGEHRNDDDFPSDPQSDHAPSDDELKNLSLSTIKGEDDLNDLKASGMMTATTADQTVDTNGETARASPQLDTVTSIENDSSSVPSTSEPSIVAPSEPEKRQVAMSPKSPEQTTLTLQIASFSDHHDDFSVPSSLGGNVRDDSPTVSKKKAFLMAEERSSYEGPFSYANLNIRENLELYFRIFVFPRDVQSDYESPRVGNTPDDIEWLNVFRHYPRIQLWPADRKRREDSMRKEMVGHFSVTPDSSSRETFRRVWKEQVVACGKGALRRLTPSRSARYGFHGELLWSAAESSHMKPEVVVECRETICCFSNKCFYVIIDHDSVSLKAKDIKKKFPKPISRTAKFTNARWPHALACHPFSSLIRVTIGFGFQRLALTFSDPNCADGFTYILLTSNKLMTVDLLKDIQELTSAETDNFLASESSVLIENDDPHVLDALTAAVAPEPLGVVLHYQIVQQRWKHGDRGSMRRVCVVTDTKIYLMDEDYVGDGSDSFEGDSEGAIGRSRNRLVDSAELHQVSQIQAATNDPKCITIVLKSLSSFTRPHNWRLVCRDGRGAEKLVEEVRRAVSHR